MKHPKPILIGEFQKPFRQTAQDKWYARLKTELVSRWKQLKYAVFILAFFGFIFLFLRFIFPEFIRPQLEAFFQIKEVQVEARLAFANEQQVVDVIEVHTQSLPLYAVEQQLFEQDLLGIPWIESVYVKKIWPGQIQIKLQETVPIALWNGEYVVSNQGDVFLPEDVEPHLALPALSGQAHEVELVMEMYRQTSQLFRRARLPLKSVEYKESLVWHLGLDQGLEGKLLTIIIDSEDTLERLNRFALNFASVLKMDRIPQRIDLRYPTGMAVSWYAD